MQRAATAFCVHFVPELLGSTKRKKDKFRHEPHDIKHVFHLFVLSAFSRVVRKLISMDAPKQEPNKIESHSLTAFLVQYLLLSTLQVNGRFVNSMRGESTHYNAISAISTVGCCSGFFENRIFFTECVKTD